MLGQRVNNARPRLHVLAASGAALALVAGLAVAGPASASSANGAHLKSPKGDGGNTTQPLLIDHLGKVLTSSTTYAIWWGPSSGFPSDSQAGITQLLQGFSGSNYLGIANQYMRGGTAGTSFAENLSDSSAPPSHSPSTSTIATEVGHVLTTNGLSPDTNAVYLVYTSNFPHVSFCAWHAAAQVNGVQTQIGYLPNTAGVAGCDPGNDFGSSVTEGTRSLADSTAHEFMETVTDPVPVTGWADKNGQEIGDKCNFVYDSSTPITLSNGSQWQIQKEWSNAANHGAGGCVDGDD